MAAVVRQKIMEMLKAKILKALIQFITVVFEFKLKMLPFGFAKQWWRS
jgi:hypothetical protein